MQFRIFIAAVMVAVPGVSLGQLMVPDSGAGDRVMLFSALDGSIIDPNWITDSGAPFAFTTPKEAAVVNGEIWVADQVVDAVHRFDFNRQFIASITSMPAGSVAPNLDNIRGFGFDGTNAYLTMFHTNTALRGIVTIDPTTAAATAFTAVAPNTTSLFDAEPFGGDLLVTNSTTNNVERRNKTTGALLSNFATTITFPQQVATMPDGSIISVSSIAAAGIEGVYHHNADGSLRRFIDTQAIKDASGELVPRGAWVLANGDYLVTTSIGVYTVRPTGPGPLNYTFNLSLGGVDAQYVNLLPEPSAITLAGIALAGLARRKR